ncbi:MAG TPA: hypothetical protein VHX65_11780 [Pirellulales bacterium]|jgi:hypothetical protein|nr:hypothetical protein [Pirellulales bacterium]
MICTRSIVFGLSLGVCLWTLPALAAPPWDGNYRTQGVDELLNTDSSATQINGWQGKDPGSFAAQQILADARLARQLAANSSPADSENLVSNGVVGKKEHHANPLLSGLIAVGAMLVLSAVALLIWSRIVQYREMREAPTPMAFNYPRL